MATTAGALDAVLATVARRRRLAESLRAVVEARGYAEVAVPLLQPAEGGGDWGGAYRVLDQDGSVLALRQDITGPVARLCASGDGGGPRPRRLHYQATIVRRLPGEGPREILQAGAERIGAAAGETGGGADFEVLDLVASCLQAAGAQDFRLAIGNVAYVRERLAQGGVPEGPALDALRARDYVALAAAVPPRLLAELRWRGPLAQALLRCGHHRGPAGCAWRAFLERVAGAAWQGHVLVEPGLVPSAGYYTGWVFEALLAGVPWPVGDGGRYDRLLGRWGASEPAVGFALDCDRLLRALAGPAVADGARRGWALLRDGENGRLK